MSLYHEYLLDLYKHPLNKRPLNTFAVHRKKSNPLCGDQVELFIAFKHDMVSEVGWTGSGCLLSEVGSSLLTDYIQGKTKKELAQITPQEIISLSGLTLNATRQRCLLLAFSALQSLTNNPREPGL